MGAAMLCAGCDEEDPTVIVDGALHVHQHARGPHDVYSGRPVVKRGGRYQYVDSVTVGPADAVPEEDFL